VTPRRLLAALALGATLAAPATAAPPPAPRDLEALHAAQAAAARHYRESLEALLPFQVAAVERAEARLTRARELLERGIVAAAEVAAGERALEQAHAAVDKTRAEVAQAAALVPEAEAAHELGALPPGAPGELTAGATLIRYAGRGPWSLAQLPALERFFRERFHRALPVSALGQTAVHDRLGFDHHAALDVAVLPDSPEGRALMEYLRARGIPFLAFRAPRAGAATGAHVHVGPPSPHA
jgi:hypothetical protein